MTSNVLKRIALVAMVIDHIGAFIPGMPLQMRWIGRISAPIFLVVFAWSIDYTHDNKKFLIRLYEFNIIMCCREQSIYARMKVNGR